MTTTFEPVNVGLGLSSFSAESTTPTTPRAPVQTPMEPLSAPPVPAAEETAQSAPSTPTRSSFTGMNGQRPLPTSPFTNTFPIQRQPLGTTRPGMPNRGESERSVESGESKDVDMEESEDGDAGSDGENAEGEGGKSSKKKKGQKFYCTDYPPCTLSFTRSEHLARHIRKHTGERPFQCHCARRFSRLDNLRQHAQTVHVNEDIPGDSLAATGTRFQRQIRTDRVRPQGNRARAGTGGSQGGHVRGHSRGLSASSIGSTSSTMSRDDGRRRPPPLIMASDSPSRGNRLSLDTLRRDDHTPPGQYSFLVDDEASTPTSTTYSTGQNSPGGYGSSLGSPSSAISRSGGLFEKRSSHSRRLSVPSGPLQYGSPQGNQYGSSPYLSPLPSSNASAFSNMNSTFGSPINANFNLPKSQAAIEAEFRRRTWHPNTSTNANHSRPQPTSGLFHQHTPDPPRPGFATQHALATNQPHRLPGFHTFDELSRRPATPPPRGPSPMQIDSSARPPVYPGPPVQPSMVVHDRRGHASWDMSLHQNLNRLDIANGAPPPPDPTSFNQRNIPLQPPRPVQNPGTFQHAQPPPLLHQERRPENEPPSFEPSNPSRSRRQGMYIGRAAPIQNSPGDSSSSEGVPTTPSGTHADHHPSIVHSNGFVEATDPSFNASMSQSASEASRNTSWPLPPEPMNPQPSGPKDTQMSGLEALVAVAENERNATTANTS